MSSIRDLVEEFVDQLSEVVESQVVARARHTVDAALAGHPLSKGNGGLRAAALSITAGLGLRKPRKKPPVQLCPVPGCTERAAPIFGMVCAKHKDVSKTKIRQYREARRAGKLGAKAGKAAKSATAAKSPRSSKSSGSSRKGAVARARKSAAGTKRTASRKMKPQRAATPPAKVEVVQKAAQVRAGSASTKVKAKRLTTTREAPPPTLAPAPAPAPASA